MDIENIAKKIIELKNADFILRARLIQNAQHSMLIVLGTTPQGCNVKSCARVKQRNTYDKSP